MSEENISQEFRIKDVDETRNYLIEDINPSDLMSKKHKMLCTALNCIEQLLVLVSAVRKCVSISAFCYLVSIPDGIATAAVRLNFFCNNCRN